MSSPTPAGDPHTSSVRRRVRIVTLLDAANHAGMTPMPILRFHAVAYLANVLAPVWELNAHDGKLLKRRGGPFYPGLQKDLDRLTGMGLVHLTRLRHEEEAPGRWRLEGFYDLNYRFAAPVLECLRTISEDERLTHAYIGELLLALSSLSDDDLDTAMQEDATYSDPQVTEGNVIDFAEWSDRNWTASAAEHFRDILPSGDRTTPGEKLHLYVAHLHRRLHGAR